MKKNNLLKLLGIAFVVAIVSTGIFYGLFVNKLSSNTGGRMLVIAARPLKPGTVLQATDLKTVLWPNEKPPNGAYETVDPLIGNTVYDTIGADEPVLAGRVANSQSGGGAGVPSGMRAVSVHVTDSSGIMALLRAGQKVDVQVVTGRNPNELVARTVLEDLKVLSVNPQAEPTSQAQNLPVVTLLAKPAEADVLALTDSGARVRLALRNPLDDDLRNRTPLSLDTVMHPSKTAPGKP